MSINKDIIIGKKFSQTRWLITSNGITLCHVTYYYRQCGTLYRSTNFWDAKMDDMLQGFCDLEGVSSYIVLRLTS
jgi:hypothetical protein